jgi:Uma2 family endonuclease
MSSADVESRCRLEFDSAGMMLTPVEFDSIEEYDESYRYELVHGVLVVNPIPSESHAGQNEKLGYLLNHYKLTHPEGCSLDETLPERYVHTQKSRRLADRVVWTGLGRQPDPTVDLPAIAVEFVSSGKRNRQRDYEIKRDEYLDIGILEYWIIDRFERTMTIYKRSEEKLSTVPAVFVVQENETYTTDLLPCFELELNKILVEADKWEESP